MTDRAESIIAEMARAAYPHMVAGGDYDAVPIDEAFARQRYQHLRERAMALGAACWSVITRRCTAAVEAADAVGPAMPERERRDAAYRRGMLRAAAIAEKFEDKILVFWERPGGPPGNGYRPLRGSDVAAAIRAEAGEEQSHG